MFQFVGCCKKKKVFIANKGQRHLAFFNVPGGWSFEGKRGGKKPDWGSQHLVNCVPQLSWGLNDVSRLFLLKKRERKKEQKPNSGQLNELF